MPNIDPIQPLRPNIRSENVAPTQSTSQTSAQAQGKQMEYLLQWLYQIALAQGLPSSFLNRITSAENRIQNDMQQNPPNLQDMQQSFNGIVDAINKKNCMEALPDWDINNGGQSGHQFMQYLLTFMQYVDGRSGQDPTLHPWIEKIADFLNQDPWPDTNDVQSFLNSLISDIGQKAYKFATNLYFHIPPLPPGNLFS